MRSGRNFCTWISIFVLGALLAGCGAARLGYSNGETISYFWLDNYVDFDAEQKPWVKKEIDSLFAWHRQTQLKDYVQVLTRLQKQVMAPVSEAQLLANEDELKKKLLVMTDKAAPSIAMLAMSMKPAQIAHMQEKFDANNDKYRKEFLRGDVEKRQAYRLKKTMSQAEYWFGSFSSAQEAQIKAASYARPLNNELLLASRLARQAQILAIIKKVEAEKLNKEATAALIRNFATDVIEKQATPEQKAFFDGYDPVERKMIALIFNITTPEQKQHFVQTLQQWIDDFNKLSAKAA
ncbi:MAG: DUF6279 family lipoprotein [Janthinobacterium lividum]